MMRAKRETRKRMPTAHSFQRVFEGFAAQNLAPTAPVAMASFPHSSAGRELSRM
jgi:hypothetical protein